MNAAKSLKQAGSLLAKIAFGAVLACVAAYFILTAVFLGLMFFSNFARDAAKPLDQELRKVGAVFICGTGDAGYGPDNTRPWYHANYVVTGNRQAAEALLRRAAGRQGLAIQKATKENRGPVMAADIYLKNWYFDNTSRTNENPLVQNGKIIYEFVLEDEKEQNPNADMCFGDKNTHHFDTDRLEFTTVSVQVKLPETHRWLLFGEY